MIKTKDSISLQRNMYILLSLQTLCRTIQCGVDTLIELIVISFPSLEGNQSIRYISEGFDVLSLLFGLSIIFALISFWAEHYFLFKLKIKEKGNLKTKHLIIRRRIMILFWVIFSSIVILVFTIFFSCVVFSLSTSNLLYKIGKAVFRISLNSISITFLLYFGIALFLVHKKKFSSVPESSLSRMTFITIYISLVMTVLIIFNIVKLILGKIYSEFDFKWIIFFVVSLADMSIVLAILILILPKNCLNFNWREAKEIDLTGIDESDEYEAFEDDAIVKEIEETEHYSEI